MTREDFIELAQRYELEARRSPGAYRRKMFLYTAFAYIAFIVAIVGLLLLLVVFTTLVIGTVAMGKNISIVVTAAAVSLPLLLVGAWAMLRMLSIPIPPPEGVKIRLRDFPAFERDLQQIAKQFKTPMPHVVLLTADFNASVQEVPRLGLLGGYRRYLCLGMPMLDSLSYLEALTVIGHEMGHLSKLHNSSKIWILRARQTWLRAVLAIEKAGANAGVVWDIFVWFETRISARTLALARQHEFEADRLAARVGSSKLLAESLVRILVNCPIWSKETDRQINKALKTEPEPPVELFDRIYAHRPAAIPPEALREKLWEEFQRPATVFDRHPSLTMRLTALGASVNPESYVEPMQRMTADAASLTFFGTKVRALRHEVGKHWTKDIVEHWHEAHEEACDHAAEVAELLKKPESTRTPREHWVLLTDYLEEENGPAACEPQLRWLVGTAPYLEEPVLELALLLSKRGSPECLDLAARMSERSSVGAIRFATDLTLDFLRRQNRNDEIESTLERFYAIQREAEARLDAAFRIDPDNPWFQQHSLTRLQVKRLAKQLHKLKTIRAWIVEKQFGDPTEPPLFILFVERQPHGFEWNEKEKRAEWMDTLLEKLVFPHRYLLIDATPNPRLVHAASRIPRSQLLPR